MIEKVNPSHPDKIADRIAGSIVDLAYELEKEPKVAVEVLIGHGNCHVIIETTVQFEKEAIEKAEMYKKIKGFSSHISNFYISCYTVDKTLEWLDNYSIDNWRAVAFMGKFYRQNIE